MKRAAVIIAALALVAGLMAGGCAKNIRTVTVDKIDPKTQKVTARVTTKTDFTDASVFHQNQVELAKLAKPINEVSFPNGGTVPAGMKITTWGPNGRFLIKQYEELIVKLVKQLKGVILQATTLGLLRPGDSSGGNTTYHGNITNNQGNLNAGRGGLQGGVSISTVSGEGNTGSSGDSSPSSTSNSTETDTLGVGF